MDKNAAMINRGPVYETSPQERAYKPVLISDRHTLYLLYESFLKSDLMVRCLLDGSASFSHGVEIEFDSCNDNAASAILVDGKVMETPVPCIRANTRGATDGAI